jgi:hypothetical protein
VIREIREIRSVREREKLLSYGESFWVDSDFLQ